MKTFEDFKLDIAKEYSFKDVTGQDVIPPIPHSFIHDEAAERYANYKAEKAHDELKNDIVMLIPNVWGNQLLETVINIPNPYKNA